MTLVAVVQRGRSVCLGVMAQYHLEHLVVGQQLSFPPVSASAARSWEMRSGVPAARWRSATGDVEAGWPARCRLQGRALSATWALNSHHRCLSTQIPVTSELPMLVIHCTSSVACNLMTSSVLVTPTVFRFLFPPAELEYATHVFGLQCAVIEGQHPGVLFPCQHFHCLQCPKSICSGAISHRLPIFPILSAVPLRWVDHCSCVNPLGSWQLWHSCLNHAHSLNLC